VARRKVTEVWEQPGRPARADAILVGARVLHQKFGYGTVMAVDDDRLDVSFEKAGENRVLDRFVEVVTSYTQPNIRPYVANTP
jgi:DNA helicase-2/ATP-dependent DNA helicase PcrA